MLTSIDYKINKLQYKYNSKSDDMLLREERRTAFLALGLLGQIRMKIKKKC